MAMNYDPVEIRGLLEHERDDLQQRIGEERERVSNYGDRTNADNTVMAQEYDVLQRSSALIEIFQRRLIQVDEAMRRMEKGTYGQCSDCGEPIDAERLRANPLLGLCTDCAPQSPDDHEAPIRPAG